MHGLGNDYIYVDVDKYDIGNPSQFSQQMSLRHYAIGSDGLVTIERKEAELYRMRIYNADGSEALMCGNAIRCVGKFLYEKGYVQSRKITIDTLSGEKHLQLYLSEGKVTRVKVDMNPPVYIHPSEEFKLPDGKLLKGIPVSVGNPHWVHITEDDPETFPLKEYGPLIENNPKYPDRNNFEVVRILDRSHILMRVWERGSGMTLACGTGACAVAAALIDLHLAEHQVKVDMPGGSLCIEWSGEPQDPIYMTGDAHLVYEGEVSL